MPGDHQIGDMSHRVVVELGVARQAELAPVLDQALDHEPRRDALAPRPGRDQAAMQRDGVEHLDLGAALDDQPLDDINAVQLPAPTGHLRQIPARRGRRPSDAMSAVPHAATTQDAVDRPFRGQRLDATGPEGLEDRLGPEEAQVTLGLQAATHFEDQVFEIGIGPLSGVGDRRTVGPIDPVQALALRVSDPAVDRGGAHAEVPGDLLLRSSPPDGLDHGLAVIGLPVSLLMMPSSRGASFQTSLYQRRSGDHGS